MKHLDEENHKRREIADMYFKGINQADVVLPPVQNISEIQINKSHVCHLFPIQHPEKETNYRNILKMKEYRP